MNRSAWLQAPIISWAKLSLICLVLLINFNTFSQKKLQFQLGDKVKVYAEKTFSKDRGKFFEAIGDVVIINNKNTLYAESASINIERGIFKVEGNVRFVTQSITLWGSYLEYNMRNETLMIQNAKMETNEYTVIASQIEKVAQDKYLAQDAEFSTCKDCPESWSILGSKLELTLEKYAKIKHGLIRVGGVEVFYIPYLVFPVKSKRQSGVLFPEFASRVSEGVSLGIPYFWAIDQDKDLTLTPTFWASRGWGGDFQYRQAISNKTWLQLDSKFIKDRVFDSQDRSDWRFLGQAQGRFQFSENTSGYFRSTQTRDLDFISDFSYFTDPYILGAELGTQAFVEYKNEYLNLQLSGARQRNLIVDDPFEFDDSFVQIQPQLDLEINPLAIYQTDGQWFHRLNFGGTFQTTKFSQNEVDETDFIRNATRFNLKPYLESQIFSHNFFQVKSRYTWDSQSYLFDESDPSFSKYAGRLESEVFFGLQKKYGRAYKERRLIDNIEQKKQERNNRELIGTLPEWEKNFFAQDELVNNSAYRHLQEIRFKHHYIIDDDERGNAAFGSQIRQAQGWFDYDDAIRREEFLLGVNDTRTLLPPENTLELKWDHTLYKDKPVDDLGDEVTSSRIAFINISQGFNLDDSSFERLSLRAGVALDGWSFSMSEFYFYDTDDHLFNASLRKTSKYIDLTARYNLNSLGANTYTLGTRLRPFSFLNFGYFNQFDIDANQTVREIYEVDYIPSNNCWKLGLSFQNTIIAQRFAFNFTLNFGDGRFDQPQDNFGI